MPFLKPVQDAMGKIRSARLDRKFDWHIKAIMEMLACVSWVIMSAPPAPSSFIKELVGASDFWGNKIRKEYKGKDDKQIAFCDTMKAMILDLSAYVKEFHLSGLMWNPRGVAMEDYEASATTSASSTVAAPTPPAPAAAKPSMPSSGDIMKELAAKRTSDGTSAATGLKKVSRDQQTWRKEFKAETTAPAVAATASTTVKPSAIKAAQVKKLGVPVCKFQSIGSKWVVENQTKESNPNGICVVEVKDPKEQVYM
jgi:adenylyl cyclase-associated protein